MPIGSLPELLEEVRKGNARGELLFYKLLERHCYPSVRAFVRARGGQDEDSRSVFNHACTVLWEKIVAKQFELNNLTDTHPHSDQMRAFVMKVAKNQFFNMIRSKGRIVYLPDDEFAGLKDANVPTEHVDTLYRAAWQVTQEMEEPCRSRLSDRFAKKLTYAEIGRSGHSAASAKAIRNSVVACVLALLAKVYESLTTSEAQRILEDMAEEAARSMPEPCKSMLGRYYLEGMKQTMAGIAGAFGYKNEHVARTAKYECLKELSLSICAKLLENPETKTT